MDKNEQEFDVEELEEPEEIRDDQDQDVTDWKSLAHKNFGIAKRFQTDLKKFKAAEEEKAKAEAEKAKQSQDKKDFDYAEKSYLMVSGVKKEEIPLYWDEYNKTGKDIDFLLNAKYFQEEISKKREFETTDKAVPSGSKRSGGTAKDSVDYWISRGEMPPKDQPELRRKVVNEKIKREEMRNRLS